ncbi:MAG: hypothetical protein ACYDAO_09480 [Thermoplasmataceae archaeon]
MTKIKLRKRRKVEIAIVIAISIIILIPYLHWYTHQNDPIILEKYSWKTYQACADSPHPKNGYLAFEKNFTINTPLGKFTLFASVFSWPFREKELDGGLRYYSCQFQFNMPIFITNESKNVSSQIGVNNLQFESKSQALSVVRVYFGSGCAANSLVISPFINITKGYTGTFNTTSGWDYFFSNFVLSFNFDKTTYNGYFYFYANEGRFNLNL